MGKWVGEFKCIFKCFNCWNGGSISRSSLGSEDVDDVDQIRLVVVVADVVCWSELGISSGKTENKTHCQY